MAAVASVDGEELLVMLACGMDDGVAFTRNWVAAAYFTGGASLTGAPAPIF